MPLPFVSVIIPTRNRRRLLRLAIEAVWRQTYDLSRLELIVVDNCSTDGTAEMMEELRKSSPCRLIYHVMPENRGPARSRNTGVRLSQGSILAFCDDDCEPWLDWVQHGISAFSEDIAFVNGPVRYRPEQVAKSTFFTRYGHEVYGENPLYTWSNSFFEREAFLKMGGTDESLCQADFLGRVVDCGDTDLAWRMKEQGYKNAFAKQAGVWHELEAMSPINWILEPLRLFNVPLLAARHPELKRRVCRWNLFFHESNGYFYLFVLGLLFGAAIHPAWLLATVPYLGWTFRLIRPGLSLRRWIKAPAQIACLAARSAAFSVALVYGSVRFRSVVL